MNALLHEIRTLPHIGGRLMVRVLADETSDGFCLFRTDASPMVDVAVVYDGSDRQRGEAEKGMRACCLGRRPCWGC